MANWHVLNVVKNGGAAKEYVSCNVAIRMVFWGTGEPTISCFNIWSISAYAIVNSFHRKQSYICILALFLCPGKSNSCTYRFAKHAECKRACAPKTVLTRYSKYFFSTEYCLRVFFEDVSTDKKLSSFHLLRPRPEFSDNHRQK